MSSDVDKLRADLVDLLEHPEKIEHPDKLRPVADKTPTTVRNTTAEYTRKELRAAQKELRKLWKAQQKRRLAEGST